MIATQLKCSIRFWHNRRFSAISLEPIKKNEFKKFCELDAKYTHLSKQIIFAKLASTLPRRRSGPCPEGTELGILKRECEKRARQKPVRQLLKQIPTLVSVLKPCFLMSPLSVAQYLPPDTALFDVIVFDEASQIPVWDAIGVIARGKQLIVVGDPKQMPPTNFFQKSEVGRCGETAGRNGGYGKYSRRMHRRRSLSDLFELALSEPP